MKMREGSRKAAQLATAFTLMAGLAATAAEAETIDYTTGTITFPVGDLAADETGDGGPASDALLVGPIDVEVGPDGTMYVVEYDAGRVRAVAADGTISTFAGLGLEELDPDTEAALIEADYGDGGPAVDAMFFSPFEIVFDAAGNAYISDIDMGRIRKVTPEGVISTFAGTDAALLLAQTVPGANAEIDPLNGDGGPAIDALLEGPSGMAVGPDGSLYFSELFTGLVRKIDPSGIISTVAGTTEEEPILITLERENSGSRNGSANFVVPDEGESTPALETQLGGPLGLDFDAEGNLYIAEQVGRISRLSNGEITRVAGVADPSGGFLSATDTEILGVLDVVVDKGGTNEGTVFFTSGGFGGNGLVYSIDATGELALVAGVPFDESSEALLLATETSMSFPLGLALDTDDTLLITDLDDGVVARVILNDSTSPAVEINAPTTIKRFGSDVPVTFDCDDNRPGVACVGSVANGSMLDTSRRTGSVSVTATDAAGLKTTETHNYEVSWEAVGEHAGDSGNDGTVTRLYAAYFGRSPEPGGFDYWTSQLEADPFTLTAASNFFASSEEFQQRYGTISNAEFVTLIYNNVMGRDAEPGGFAFWLEQLAAKNYTRGQVMLFFSQSTEFMGLTKTS